MAVGRALRVAQVGCGQISAAHFKAYAESPSVELVAVVDTDREAAQAAAAANGNVPWTERFEDVLEREDVQLVSVATPHHLHAPQVVAAARAGKHVLCEKPLTTSVAAADEMLAAARAAGVALGMWLPFRYQAHVNVARALVRTGAIGDVVNIRLPDVHDKVQDYYQRGVGGRARPSAWRGGRETSGGGALIMNAIHQIDVLRHITGLEVTRVSAEWINFTGLAEVEDMIAVLLRYSNGAIGSIDTANYAPGGGEPSVVRLYGSRGQLQLTSRGLRAFVVAPVVGLDGVPDLVAGEWQDVPATQSRDARTLLLDAFVAAVGAGEEPPVSGADGRACLATVLAAYESAASGRSVSLGA
jgi:UDP-N-acetyl-2-amino-2-deoxyglucuronate dehydrogenase